MNSNINHFHSVVRGDIQSDSTKLASLLALAAGAVTLPQTSHADIIYTDRTSNPGMVGPAGDALFLFDLPDTATFGFQRLEAFGYTQPGSLLVNYRFVLAGDLNDADAFDHGIQGAAGIAQAIPFGGAWSQGLEYGNIPVGIADDLNGQTPATGYERQYLAWFFEDSGNARFYGWAEVSLSMASYNLGGPTVTIWGYAYDDTGLKPTMGQGIPEPGSGALLAMGAMALGVRGLRKWRQSRLPQNPA